ncbi:MAG: hypothetical protein V1820_00440 [archaeon]
MPITELERIEFDFGMSWGSRNLLPVEFVESAFSEILVSDLEPDSPKFPEAVFRTLPFRVRREEFALTAGLFDPIAKILPALGRVGIMRPSPVAISGSAGFSGIGELERFLKTGGSLGGLLVRPDVSLPSGETLPVGERRALVELAEKNNFIILEDGSGRNLSFGSPLPPIKSFDETGRVAYFSDFSGEFLPNIGLGIFSASEELAERISAVSAPTVLGKFAVKKWLEAGGIEDFRKRGLSLYRKRVEIALEIAEDDLRACKSGAPSGGWHIRLKIPNSPKILQTARMEGVNFLPGTLFFPENPSLGNDLAFLNVGALHEDRIVKGLRCLSTLI